MPKKQQAAQVSLRYPAQYIWSSMANRFHLERDDGFTLAYFGLVSKAGILLNQFSFVFTEHMLQSQKENLVQYSDQIGVSEKEIPKWIPPTPVATDKMLHPVVDFIHVSNWEKAHAEICFWNYSQGHFADLVRMGAKEGLTPFGVAMLRCDIDLQRAFLAQLYDV